MSKKTETKPLAVIIKGNPKYIKNPKIKPMAVKFYSSIKKILEELGYRVKMDDGLPYTTPDTNAAVWIAHSRGIDRLQFAPKGVKRIALKTNDSYDKHHDKDRNGKDPLHYELSDSDIRKLNALPKHSEESKPSVESAEPVVLKDPIFNRW